MKRSFNRRGTGLGRRHGIRTAKGKNRLKDNFKRLIICIIIVILVLIIKNAQFSLARKATEGIKYIITSEFDFKEKLDTLRDLVPAFKDRFQNNSGSNGSTSSMIMPVEGPIVSGYGMRIHPVFNTERKHEGIDIDAQMGDPVKAVLDGIVAEVRQDDYFGNVVVLDHGNQMTTVYAHLGEVAVEEGQQVLQGDLIGSVGNTGITTGTHLHFEVRRKGRAVDPVNELETGVRGM